MSTIEVEHSPLPADIERYEGRWVAIRHGSIVVAADTLGALTEDERVEVASDLLYQVPERGTYFYYPALRVDYNAGGQPVIAIAITSSRPPNPTVFVPMVIDSGASMTLLAKSYLKPLGLRLADVERDPDAASGVKSRFVTWRSKVPLTGQVYRHVSESPQPWGPVFPLDVRFAAGAPALAGRRDFFQHFMVTFCEGAQPFFYLHHD